MKFVCSLTIEGLALERCKDSRYGRMGFNVGGPEIAKSTPWRSHKKEGIKVASFSRGKSPNSCSCSVLLEGEGEVSGVSDTLS